jgi:hypothetical protein
VAAAAAVSWRSWLFAGGWRRADRFSRHQSEHFQNYFTCQSTPFGKQRSSLIKITIVDLVILTIVAGRSGARAL